MQTPTSTAAALMAPAHIVFDFNDGSEALEAVMVPARVPAMLALAEAGTNKRTVRQSDGFRFGCGSSKPSARDVSARVLQLTDLLSNLAHGMRSVRWNNRPAARLRDEFFPKDDGSGSGLSWDVIAHLVWIQDAAEKLAAQGCETTHAEVMSVIQVANLYPNVSPSTEAKLATKGYTTAEHLTLMACTAAKHVVQALGQVESPADQQLGNVALQASALLTEAQAVISLGVTHDVQV